MSYRVFVTSSYGFWGDFTPRDLTNGSRQVGGGETAMVSVARELSKLGNEVVVFHDCKTGRYDGVDYLPTSFYAPMITSMEHDVLVAWDSTYAFRFADRARMHVLAFQLNDTYIGPFDWEIDLYMHPSQWHADRFASLYPEISRVAGKQRSRITNGLDFNRYLKVDKPERQPFRVVYSSSPDRGLHHLLRIWPRIMEVEPRAELHVFYDVAKWLNLCENLMKAGVPNITQERYNLIDPIYSRPPEGVVFRGGVGQAQLAREQQSAQVLAYPCDPVQPTEGFSMTVLEGIAAGCNVVISNADAFPELWSGAPGVTMLPLPVDDDLWVETLLGKLGKPIVDDYRVKLDYSWASIAGRWQQEIDEWMTSQ